MRIAILAAKVSGQASTVRDSIQCFWEFGSAKYTLVTIVNGDFDARLNEFDAVIIHYSTIAYPFKSELPLSSLSAIKLHNYKGLKVALVQDEQRACYERFDFLQVIGVHHVFSVAPTDVVPLLYPPELRNFSVSTVLTGYISNKHKEIASISRPLIERPQDLVYRGRVLPSWMGKDAELKGEIPRLVIDELKKSKNSYRVDVSSEESDRIYGDEWYDFLLNSRVSIGTPSGSSFLDLWGKHSEAWIRERSTESDSDKSPIKANYQVISPRYFEYLAAGNLVALTPGNYSQVPIEYCPLNESMNNLVEILEYAKSSDAQKRVDKAKEIVFSRSDLTFVAFVTNIEKIIYSLASKSYVTRDWNFIGTAAVPTAKNREAIMSKFIRRLNRYLNKVNRARNVLSKIRLSIHLIKYLITRKPYLTIKYIKTRKISDYCNLRLWLELDRLVSLIKAFQTIPKIQKGLQGSIQVLFSSPSASDTKCKKVSIPSADSWIIDVSDFGKGKEVDRLRAIPTRLNKSEKLLTELIETLTN